MASPPRLKRAVFLIFIVLATLYFLLFVLHSSAKTEKNNFSNFFSLNEHFGRSNKQHTSVYDKGSLSNLAEQNNLQGVNIHENVKNDGQFLTSANYSSLYGSCSSFKMVPGQTYHQDKYVYFTDSFVIDRNPQASWMEVAKRRLYCDDRYTIFDQRMAELREVVLHPDLIANKKTVAKGGEEVRHVLNQGLAKEDYNFQQGFLEMFCKSGTTGLTRGALKLFSNVKFQDISAVNITDKLKQYEYEKRLTIAIVREDYANLHNWARAVYNAIFIMMYLNVQPQDVNILFMDGHPFTNLDDSWKHIFGSVERVGRLEKPILYRQLVLSFKENDGLVSNFRMKETAYLEECRSVVLQQHNLNPKAALQCKRLTITLLLRRNAVFHPRNVEGRVGRKIFNEAQVIDALMKAFPGACVQSVLMESLPMNLQLQMISQTDLLIGMHGAGMTHSLFLPQHGAILELFAKGFKTGRPWFECYQSIARWRNLKYDSWENFDEKSVMPHDFTILPVDVVVQKAKGLAEKLCPGS